MEKMVEEGEWRFHCFRGSSLGSELLKEKVRGVEAQALLLAPEIKGKVAGEERRKAWKKNR